MVEDHGFGIPNDEIKKLFQPFSITSVKSSASEKSTGLGLVSVK
jgi:signal transduction histidine kinase